LSKDENKQNLNTENEKREKKELFRALSFFSQISVTIISCIVIGVILGKFLDGVFGTSPVLLLIFSLLGTGAAFKSIFDMSGRDK